MHQGPRPAAAALRHLPVRAKVEIAECVPAVIAWNRGPLAHLAGRPLEDGRVRVCEADVAQVLRTERNSLDAFLLDVDNSPNGFTRPGNSWLYAPPGLKAAFDALRPGGVFAIWSVAPDDGFTRVTYSWSLTVLDAFFAARSSRSRNTTRDPGARVEEANG